MDFIASSLESSGHTTQSQKNNCTKFRYFMIFNSPWRERGRERERIGSREIPLNDHPVRMPLTFPDAFPLCRFNCSLAPAEAAAGKVLSFSCKMSCTRAFATTSAGQRVRDGNERWAPNVRVLPENDLFH